jgi:hypothetical protein
MERATNTHSGKPGYQALQKSSFPGIAFSNRVEEMTQQTANSKRASDHLPIPHIHSSIFH